MALLSTMLNTCPPGAWIEKNGFSRSFYVVDRYTSKQ